MLISTPKQKIKKNKKDIIIIDINYSIFICFLKKIWVFTVSIRYLEFQAKKELRPETSLKSVLPENYDNFIYIFFSKKISIYFSLMTNIIIESSKKVKKHGYDFSNKIFKIEILRSQTLIKFILI